MLFKPSWEIRSLEGFIAWLETKAAGETYNWHDCGGECAYGQYMAAHGIPWSVAAVDHDFRRVVYGIAHQFPWTFGAALERARKAVA